MKTKHFHEVDFMYTLGVILVIIGHSHTSDWTKIYGTPIDYVINFIYTFHMPLFFAIAGFLFLNSHKIERIGFWKYIGEKAIKLFVPYFSLSLVLLIPKTRMNTGKWFDISYIFTSLLSPRDGVWGHLWFVPVLFLCYAVFGLLYRAFKKHFFISVIVSAVVGIVLYFIPCQINWIGLADFMNAVVFFVFGMLVYTAFPQLQKIRNPFKFVLSIIGLVLSLVLYVFFVKYQTVNLIIAIIMILTCWITSTVVKQNKICSWISKHNFTMYLYSWPAQFMVMTVCDRLQFSWLLTFFIMFTTGFLFPIVLCTAYEKLTKINCRFLDLVLGVK